MFKAIPQIIESFYSMKIYKFINIPLNIITGLFPFSISEVGIYLILLFFFYKILVLFKNLIQGKIIFKSFKPILIIVKRILLYACVIYFSFLCLWGLNYHRIPFADAANIKVNQYSKKNLEELCLHLIEQANLLREEVNENSLGIMTIPQGKRWVLENANIGFDNISNVYNTLSGQYGKPKPVLLSEFMCYTGIAGIYFPFTGEANININVPYPNLPSTVTHEMAHQRGYAREDEANFIAYLSSVSNPYVEFKYSGTLLALTHSVNALYKEDKEIYEKLKGNFSEGLLRDLNHINSFWEKYEGPLERASTDLNNAYLKANNQKDGIKSYGRMVDLLIAYYDENK